MIFDLRKCSSKALLQKKAGLCTSPQPLMAHVLLPLNNTTEAMNQKRVVGQYRTPSGSYPLSQNDYRQEKIIFKLFSGALQENPVIALGSIT